MINPIAFTLFLLGFLLFTEDSKARNGDFKHRIKISFLVKD